MLHDPAAQNAAGGQEQHDDRAMKAMAVMTRLKVSVASTPR
jgi:hypothetical protein